MLTPIQLTPADYLRRPDVPYPVVITDATLLPTDSEDAVGIHDICEGSLHLTPIASPFSVVSCWKCSLRVPVSSAGLTTYGALRSAANTTTGLAVLDGTGTAVVLNAWVAATTVFILTVQDGGAPPTGAVYQSARVVSTSFTIKSTAGGADVGVQVYYQLWGPTTP